MIPHQLQVCQQLRSENIIKLLFIRSRNIVQLLTDITVPPPKYPLDMNIVQL